MIIKPNSFGTNVRIEHLISAIQGLDFKVATELGCGQAYLLANVEAKQKYGYDLKPIKTFSDILYKKANLEDDNVTLPKSDLVICSEVIEHIENDDVFMRKMYDSLNEGGLLFLTTINSNISEEDKKIKSIKDLERGHHRRYDIGELAKKLGSKGFGVIESYPMRSEHYYRAKLGFVKYDLEIDKEQGKEQASGLVYFGVKL